MIEDLTYQNRAQAISKAKELAGVSGETHHVCKSLGVYEIFHEGETRFGALIYSTDEE